MIANAVLIDCLRANPVFAQLDDAALDVVLAEGGDTAGQAVGEDQDGGS